jgi:hypothetical protein
MDGYPVGRSGSGSRWAIGWYSGRPVLSNRGRWPPRRVPDPGSGDRPPGSGIGHRAHRPFDSPLLAYILGEWEGGPLLFVTSYKWALCVKRVLSCIIFSLNCVLHTYR